MSSAPTNDTDATATNGGRASNANGEFWVLVVLLLESVSSFKGSYYFRASCGCCLRLYSTNLVLTFVHSTSLIQIPFLTPLNQHDNYSWLDWKTWTYEPIDDHDLQKTKWLLPSSVDTLVSFASTKSRRFSQVPLPWKTLPLPLLYRAVPAPSRMWTRRSSEHSWSPRKMLISLLIRGRSKKKAWNEWNTDTSGFII